MRQCYFNGVWEDCDLDVCWNPQRGGETPTEVDDIAASFDRLLRQASGDGAKKRAAGTKPPWIEDPTHMGAFYRHMHRYQEGETVDADSGADPRIHMAWRLLAAVDYDQHQEAKRG